MREENIKRNSRKRLNALILLVAFTAILLIVATYAWFSTQKNVTLGGLAGTVNVAEGLQISLDAKNWANEISLKEGEVEEFLDAGKTLATPYAGRTNLIPSELLPVSTTAQQDEGIGLGDLNMYRGVNESGIELSEIKNMTTDESGEEKGFYAIDFFLQNSSSQTAIESSINDVLRLETNSAIKLNGGLAKESTGLQNTLRVAFAIFDEDTLLSADTVVGSATANQTTILAATTGEDRQITDVAIWEPNAEGAQQGTSPSIKKYAAHVDYIVQNNNRLTLSDEDNPTNSVLDSTGKFAANTKLPTYALTATSVGKSITDIYDWDTGATTNGLVKQNTVTTDNTGVIAAPVQLKSVKADGTTDFSIAPGKYIHMRMYVWLEGQDVDCINYASLGGPLTIDVGLSKPGSAEDEEEEEEP